MSRHANYALVTFGEHLGGNEDALQVPWAEFVGDESSELSFTVPSDDAGDAFVLVQAYDVGAFGHEILINGESLSGFDIPPAEGWQAWMDAVTGTELREGENTVKVRRDPESRDDFVVGACTVNWTQPV